MRLHMLLGTTAASALLVAGCGSKSSSDPSASKGSSSAQEASVQSGAGMKKMTMVSGRKVTIRGTEFAFQPSTVMAKAGKLTLTLDNQGKTTHELIVLKTSAAPGALPVNGSGRVSEKASVGEVSETDAGAKGTATLKLKPGRYLLVCNIPGHYKSGMVARLTVS